MAAYTELLSGSFGPLARLALNAVTMVAALALIATVVIHLVKVVWSGGKTGAIMSALLAIAVAAVAYQALADLPATLIVVSAFGQTVWASVGDAVRASLV